MSSLTPGRTLIAAGCIYEIVAVTTDRVPTITELVKRGARAPRWGRIFWWMVVGFMVDHFIEREVAA